MQIALDQSNHSNISLPMDESVPQSVPFTEDGLLTLPYWRILAILLWNCASPAFIIWVVSTVLRRFLGLRVIGLTGGISTGKSTCSFYLKEEIHLPIVDFDEIAHDIYACGKSAWSRIRAEFGDGVLNPDWTINRQALGQMVWKDRTQLSKLMAITRWPIIKEFVVQLLFNVMEGRLQILDCPLLIEQKYIQYLVCDSIVLIYCDKSTQIRRLKEREKGEGKDLSTKEALNKLDKQLDIDDKKRYVIGNRNNTVIDNCKQLTNTQRQLNVFVEECDALEDLNEWCPWKRALRPTKLSLWISIVLCTVGYVSHWIVTLMPPRWSP